MKVPLPFWKIVHPKVVDMMDNFEYSGAWWHRTANDKREAKAFVEKWNSGGGSDKQI